MEDIKRDHQRILRRHRREKKELEDQIQSMKRSVPKGDREQRKQLRLNIARLQAELEQRHLRELEKFQEKFPSSHALDSLAQNLAKLNLENRHPHSSKARRRRERREAEEREEQERALAAELEPLEDFRKEEEARLVAILAARGLEMKALPLDSQCMFRAVQDQLPFVATVDGLRRRVADYMRRHVDDFLPFFNTDDDDDDEEEPLTREDFLAHCEHVARLRPWGGQLELRALSHVLRRPMEVVQAAGPALLLGEQYRCKPVTLVYVQYACSLGEHYNSVQPLRAGAPAPAPRLL
ncbi:OTU domain-containing protein 6A-like [Octodon degus]|uniref:ubiquitinyl hydrolase 1 n=1 Tax=Octodon degus TaxID=10160 RepID=A0A6P3FMU6_OCTDE|nr:OTU domain-containing protein 6A-like [Octodon degus]